MIQYDYTEIYKESLKISKEASQKPLEEIIEVILKKLSSTSPDEHELDDILYKIVDSGKLVDCLTEDDKSKLYKYYLLITTEQWFQE